MGNLFSDQKMKNLNKSARELRREVFGKLRLSYKDQPTS